MEPDWSLDVRIAPEGALGRISGSINKRKKRLFGVLKTEKEFVGVVRDGGFEIWERQQRAIHGVGTLLARRGGTRIEMRFVVPTRTRVLLALFFLLYGAVTVGIVKQKPDPVMSVTEAVIAAAGIVALVVIFAASAVRQRSEMRAFVERLFEDVARG